jgi:hypothetical protein
MSEFQISRRGLLFTMGGVIVGTSRLYAFSDDFWNKKDPGEWTSEEKDKLTTKSPWAKEVGANYTPTNIQRGNGGGGMGGGGMGGGRRGGGGGRPGGMPSQNFKGTIRWESAKPIQDALKQPLADPFANHYVISVTGIPIQEFGRRQQQQSSDSSTQAQSMQDVLDHLKSVTFLQPKDKRDVQPGVVQQPAAGSYGDAVLFGFSKEVLTLTLDDKEVTFVTSFGRLDLKAKFNLKEMKYKGELAV